MCGDHGTGIIQCPFLQPQVWCPPDFATLVLVDDSGKHLNSGTPTGQLPSLSERQLNFRMVQGSKYATQAEGVHDHNGKASPV